MSISGYTKFIAIIGTLIGIILTILLIKPRVSAATTQLTGGPGEDYQLHWSYQPKPSNVLQAWNNYFAQSDLKQWKSKFSWNLIRLGFWFSNLENDSQEIPLDPTNKDGTLTLLDNVISICANNGFKVMLCCFNYTGSTFSSLQEINIWLNDWQLMAQHYRGDTRIAMYQIANELEDSTLIDQNYGSKDGVLLKCTQIIRQYEPARVVAWPTAVPLTVTNPGGVYRDWHVSTYAKGGGCMEQSQIQNWPQVMIKDYQQYGVPTVNGEINAQDSNCNSESVQWLQQMIKYNIPYICWGYNAYRKNWDAILNNV